MHANGITHPRKDRCLTPKVRSVGADQLQVVAKYLGCFSGG